MSHASLFSYHSWTLFLCLFLTYHVSEVEPVSTSSSSSGFVHPSPLVSFPSASSASSVLKNDAIASLTNEEIVPVKLKRKQRNYNDDNVSITKKKFDPQLPSCASVLPEPSSPSSSSLPSSFTGVCTDRWSDLKSIIRPTQKAVGYAWVHYKLLKDFTTKRTVQIAMDNSVTPAVLGPAVPNRYNNYTSAIYIIDDHHTFSALDMSNYDSIMVTINIICDLRTFTVPNFWSYMQHHNYTIMAAYPHNQAKRLPEPIDYHDMPINITFRPHLKTLSDDPWRSLVGFSRKIKDVHPSVLAYYTSSTTSSTRTTGKNKPEYSSTDTNANTVIGECLPSAKYCFRCFYRGCDSDGAQTYGSSVPFFEFRWSYYFLDAYLNPEKYWPTKSSYTLFKQTYDLLPSSTTVPLEKVYLQQWFTTASLLLPLCHHSTTGKYILPENIFEGNHTHLPGYTSNFMINESDAVCDQPSVCKLR